MADFPSAVATDRPADPTVYKPLAPLALAAFLLSALYALVILVVMLAAWFMQMSPFLGFWSMLVPLAALGLAWAARQQIRRSEGTRAGDALVTWSFWLAGGFGSLYAAIYFAIFFPVKWQSAQFTEDWIGKIQKSELNAAFLLMQPPDERQDINPSDKAYMDRRYGVGTSGRKAALPNFKDSEAVRVISMAGEDMKVENLGIRGWDYGQEGYHVVQIYRLTTPEGVFDLQVSLRSDNRKKTRRWRVLEADSSFQNKQLNARGQALQEWRSSASHFANSWVGKKNKGDLAGLYLDTREAHERPRLSRGLEARLLGSRFAANATAGLAGLAYYLWPVPADPAASFFPEYARFIDGGLIDVSSLDAPEKVKQDILNESKNLFRNPNVQFRMAQAPSQPAEINEKDRRVRYVQEMSFAPQPEAGHRSPRFVCEGRLVLESDVGDLTPERHPQWRWLRIELLRGMDPSDDSRSRPTPTPTAR